MISHYDGPNRYLLLSPYPGQHAPVVATAWGAQLSLDSVSDPRLLAFLEHYIGGNQGGREGRLLRGRLRHARRLTPPALAPHAERGSGPWSTPPNSVLRVLMLPTIESVLTARRSRL